MKPKTSHKPCCPNHGEPLEGLGFPMKSKGVGICPVSKCPFDYEISLDQSTSGVLLDKFGNKVKSNGFKVTGDEK